LYTRLLLRDENLVLYGFASIEEMGLFETLTSVSGIGPKLGLALLSAMKAEQLAAAIASSDVDLLTTVPGVGKKTAARIVLELKDKIAAGVALAPAQVARESADVLAALASLGYSPAEASRAVAALPSGDLTLEEKVRQALAYFTRR
jgi:Holliday junction DNA helicase RuvA